MKSNSIFYLIFCLFFLIADTHPEGFLANTLIKTASGYAYIEQLSPKDSILSYRIDDSEVSLHSIITHVNNIDGDFFIQISIDNTKICCAPDQQFYSYNKQQWIRKKIWKNN